MTLKPGTMLGQYEIRELIGKGGMGEIYHGFDTKLKRDVALKVLPAEFARDFSSRGFMGLITTWLPMASGS